jgi:hypothetical protein
LARLSASTKRSKCCKVEFWHAIGDTTLFQPLRAPPDAVW